MKNRNSVVILRGGGDLASGVALRLHRAGIKVVITELPWPLVVRRLVAFASAIYAGEFVVEGITAKRVSNGSEAQRVLHEGKIPILVDPDCEIRDAPEFEVSAMIDARMTKMPPELGMAAAAMVIGLGPGFVGGENCHAAIETNRGHFLGRVIWQGAPQANTGIPGMIAAQRAERVLRAPADGTMRIAIDIGSHVDQGQAIAHVAGEPILAPFDGIIRGLVYDDLIVRQGMKIGDVDPRDDPSYVRTASEKSLAIAGGVLEALLARPEIRQTLWS